MTELPHIDVYPVGLLADIKHRRVGRGFRRLGSLVRQRKWHAMKTHLNGYLAEPSYTNLIVHTCGHGWTKRRALARMGRYLGESNPGAAAEAEREREDAKEGADA